MAAALGCASSSNAWQRQQVVGQRDGTSRAATAPHGGSPRWPVMRLEQQRGSRTGRPHGRASMAARTPGPYGSSTAQPGRSARGGQPSVPTRVRAERPTRRRRAPGAGDRAQPGKQPENTPSTDFKALEKPKPLIQFPNHLCYTLEGIFGY